MKNETQVVRFDWAIKTLLREKANFHDFEGYENYAVYSKTYDKSDI